MTHTYLGTKERGLDFYYGPKYKKKRRKIDPVRVWQMFNSGERVAVIAAEMKVTQSAVYRVMKKFEYMNL